MRVITSAEKRKNSTGGFPAERPIIPRESLCLCPERLFLRASSFYDNMSQKRISFNACSKVMEIDMIVSYCPVSSPSLPDLVFLTS